LLVVYLVTSTELGQLCKLPLLVQHYAEHKAENNSLSLIQFFYIHYGQGEIRKVDDDKDMKLPFKTPLVSANSIFIAMTQSIHFFSIFINKEIQPKNYTLYQAFFYFSTLDSIWRPPQKS
jgi:hypothetical protein